MVFLNGDAIPESDEMGRRITDDHFLLMFNASSTDLTFWVPPVAFGDHWVLQLETADGTVGPVDGEAWDAQTEHVIPAHSMAVLSTAVVPPEERQAAEQRALEAMAVAAKKSENPPRRRKTSA